MYKIEQINTRILTWIFI